VNPFGPARPQSDIARRRPPIRGIMRNSILLVDDDKNDLDLTMMAFERAGVENPVVIAKDGAEALDWMTRPAASDDRPAVVLLDLDLPLLTGLEVLRHRRRDVALWNVPVVVLTSSRNPDNVAKCYEGGANAYIHKPVGFRLLVEVVGSIARMWGKYNLPATLPPACDSSRILPETILPGDSR
jgi:CheY-like chemotaxis protein